VDSHGDTRHQCPLSATRNGLDGRITRGHVDDYWIYYGQPGPDPYEINSWPKHADSDCTGDFMETNEWFAAKSFNQDASTRFYYYSDGSQTPAADLEGAGLHIYDGIYGLKEFYESRGYTVNTMYNQYILGYVSTTLGFTLISIKLKSMPDDLS